MAESHQKDPPGSSRIRDYGTFGSSYKEEFEAAIYKGKLTDALSTIVDKPRESFADFPLHIAIIGEPGSGKTSFINTLQNPHLAGSAAAATDIVARTEVPDRINAEFHQVSFSEITCKGELLVAEDIHGKKADLNDFDFFILIAPQSSQATRLQIASEVQQMDKEFYMVQTKIDLDLEEAKKQQLSGYSEEKILLPAKDFCRDSLENEEVKDPQVFAVSNHKPNDYDFPLLRESLTSDLLWNKKKAFLRNVVTTVSPSVLENKAATLQREIWLPILFTGFIAVIPVPGVAILGGVVLFVAFGVWCYRKFGVDNQSLIKLAKFTGKLLSELKSMMTSQSKKTVILHRLPDFLGASMMSVEYFYWERFPIIGCLLSGGISLISSFFMLKKYLSDIKKDTQNILSKAAAAIKKINLAIP